MVSSFPPSGCGIREVAMSRNQCIQLPDFMETRNGVALGWIVTCPYTCKCLYTSTLASTRGQSIYRATNNSKEPQKLWKELYRDGYRCVKIRLEVE